jgi:hypothetical protein
VFLSVPWKVRNRVWSKIMSAWKQTASKGGEGSFEKAPPGNHLAVCVALVDMGTQTVKAFNPGDKDKDQHRGYFVWELVGEKKADGTNHLLGLDLNLSMNDKAKLRKWVESRIGRRLAEGEVYDILAEVGAPCLLNVVEKNGYPRVEGMSAVPKGMAVPAPTYKPFVWHLSEAEAGKIDLPGWIPWLFGRPLGEHVKECHELKGRGLSATYSGQPVPAANGQANGKAPPPPPAAGGPPSPPPAPSAAGRRFYVAFEGKSLGPVDAAAVGHLLLEKGLTPNAMVCPEDGAEWRPASNFGIVLPF